MNAQENTSVTNDTEADLLGPPLALSRFIRQMGVTAITAWRWRRDGKLATVNICGRQYVSAEEIAKFNRRVNAGKFAHENKAPNPAQRRTLGRARRGRPQSLATAPVP